MHTIAVLSLMLIAASISSTASGQGADRLAALAWLSGCWSADGAELGSGEQWLPAAGGTMFGVSRTVKGGKTVASEFMQLRANAEGRLTFIATPSGQNETSFAMTDGATGVATFENLQHDFPQRVIYRRLLDGRMLGRIEGLQNGARRGIDFPMTRVVCEAWGRRP